MHFLLIPILWLMIGAIFSGGYTASCSYVDEEMRRKKEWTNYTISEKVTYDDLVDCGYSGSELK